MASYDRGAEEERPKPHFAWERRLPRRRTTLTLTLFSGVKPTRAERGSSSRDREKRTTVGIRRLEQ